MIWSAWWSIKSYLGWSRRSQVGSITKWPPEVISKLVYSIIHYKEGFLGSTEGSHDLEKNQILHLTCSVLKSSIRPPWWTLCWITLNFSSFSYITVFSYNADYHSHTQQFSTMFVLYIFMSQLRLATVSTLQDKPCYRQSRISCVWLNPGCQTELKENTNVHCHS